jgi:hypothetical protein
MTSNPAPIVQQLQHEFQSLLAYVTGPDARLQTAYTVELTLFRRLLALGAALLRLFFITRAAVRPAAPVTALDGTRLTYHDQRPTTYYSVFGKVPFERPYFTAPGQEGLCPLDAELSLPARCYSDLLREWAVHGTTDESYRESQTVLERILGLSLSIQALETAVVEAAVDVTSFYEQTAEPAAPPPTATILVVQADGKGVPMVQPSTQKPAVRLGKGQKRTKKKEAVVTGLYTISPYPRTPQEVVAALLDDEHPPSAARPVPVGKELRATLAGKADAMRRLAQRVAQHEGPHIQQRVALTDGAEALQQQLVTHFPGYTLILDIIHATEYLWDTANALLGESHPQRLAWVRAYLEALLAGQTDAVITALEAEGKDPICTVTQRQAVRRAVGYYRRNRLYMRYDEYLACGWPIGTGVVEGACRHLVKDRMEQSGMRWTKGGAQAVLDLRAVRLNGHWEVYWQFHRNQQHQRLYGHFAPAPALAEAQALEWAA